MAVESTLISGSVYREHRSPSVVEDGRIDCTWEQRPAVDRMQLIVPDGSVDLIWLAGQDLVIAGPDSQPREVWLPAERWSSGLRLRPGIAGGFLGVPAYEVRDQQVFADTLMGPSVSQLTDALAASSLPERVTLLADWVLARTPPPDPLVAAAADRLSTVGSRVSEVARDLGVSERRMHRSITAAVGYGPKVFARVLRLRRLTRSAADSLADRAIAAGYASQSHMNQEVRRLTGQTPVRFLKDSKPLST